MERDNVLKVRGLDVSFRTNDGPVHAVKGIDFDVFAGEAVAIVGESGSGKSQTMMAMMGLLASNGEARGSALYRDQELIGLSERRLNKVRGETNAASVISSTVTASKPRTSNSARATSTSRSRVRAFLRSRSPPSTCDTVGPEVAAMPDGRRDSSITSRAGTLLRRGSRAPVAARLRRPRVRSR